MAGLSVATRAFAHAAKVKLTERAREIFETGANYRIYRALT
nr:hypothetical protein [Hydrococcus rivularis]